MRRIIINQEIIDKTKCNFDFLCLKNSKPKCKVERVIGKICLLNTCSKEICNNCETFGYSAICNCPVRVDIFNKYKF